MSGPGKRRRLADLGPTWGAWIALVLLVLVNGMFTDGFATPRTFWTILLQVSTTVMVATGMTLVIATGGIDLAVGATMAIASAVAVLTLPWGPAAAVGAALLVGLAIGALNGFFVATMRIAPFIVTLAFLITGRGLAQVISREGQLIPFDDPGFLFLGRGRFGPVPVQVLFTAWLFGFALFLLRATTFGRYAVAVGGNEHAARLAGVPVARTRWLVYVASGLASACAGIVETARLGTTDAANVGNGMELAAIAAVVVGGTPLTGGRATLPGTLVGALIMAVIGASFNMRLLPFAWSLVVTGAIILVAVFVQRPRVA